MRNGGKPMENKFTEYGYGDIGFLMRAEWGRVFDVLDNELAGELIKMMYEYVRGNEDISTDTAELIPVWELIKVSLGE
jgi:hypothetical protein